MEGDQPNWPDERIVQKVLQHWLGVPEARVTEFKTEIATKKGDNYTSNMFRVRVKCEERELPISFIFKRLLQEFSQASSYAREKHMLSVVLPKMHSVLKKAFPECEPFGPEFIYATPGVLVMGDLLEEGFHMAERQQGLDLLHCSLVMRTLARYHAASVFLMEHKSVDFSVLQKSAFGEGNDTLANFCNNMFSTLSEEIRDFEGLEKYGPKLAKFADENFNNRLQHVVEDYEEDDFRVLSHGDLWVNNILFRYSSSKELEGIRFIDFQMPCITSPCIDLQCFLTTSCNEEVRASCLEQLLEEYHEALCKTMEALKCSTRPPTYEYLREEYDRKTFYGMFAVISGLPIVLSEPGQFQIVDIAEGKDPQKVMFRSSPYKRALKWYLPILESKGYL